MPTNQTAQLDELDQFVRDFQAKRGAQELDDDDLDAFVAKHKALALSNAPAVAAGGTPTEQASRIGRGIQLEPPPFDLTQVPRDPFTNRLVTAPPIATEEEAARNGTIGPAPTRSVIGTQKNPFPGENRRVTDRSAEDIARSVIPLAFRDQQNQPGDTQLIHPEGLLTPVEQQKSPIATGLMQSLGGLTTPENIALTAGTAGVGEAPGLIGKALKFGLSAAFGTQMAKGVYDEIPGIQDAWKRGDMSEVKRLATIAGVNTVMAGAAFGHAGSELNEGVNGEAVPTTIPKITDQRRIGAGGEQLHPETPETLQRQVDALAAGTNPVVYFPKGQGAIPEPPEGATVTVVKGGRAGAGTYYHDARVTADEVRASVEDGSYGKLLGFTQSKEEAHAGNAPTVVTARDTDGTELKSGLADSKNPRAIAAQAAELARQFPKAKIGVESPEQVISSRQGVSAQSSGSEQQAGLSEQTQAPDELDDFVQGHKEAPAVIAPQAGELRSLASDVHDIDPHLADSLNGLADGRYHTPQELLKITGGIRNAKAAEDLKAILSEYRPESAEPGVARRTNTRSQTAEASGTEFLPENAGEVREPAKELRAGEVEDRNQLNRQGSDNLDDFVKTYREQPAALRDLLNPRDEELAGTRYSGLAPAALKRLLPPEVRERLDAEVEANQRARSLQGGLYDLDSKNAADLIRARNVLKDAPGTPKDMEAIYHHLEDPSIQLTPEQTRIRDRYLRPLREEAERINEKLGGGQVENYVHRIPVGKNSLLDRVVSGEGKVGAGRGLSKSAGSLKTRTMMALEDEAGSRKVVAIKNGEVTAWEKGKSEQLGKYRQPDEPGVDEYYDKHVMEKLQKLADDLGISHERTAKKFGGNVMGRSLTGQNKIQTLAGTPEQVIIHEIGHQLDERYNLQDKFVADPAIKKELRELVDLKWEGQQTSKYFKTYVRKGGEKIAAMFETLLQAPERFHQVAPKAYGKFTEFLASHPETKPILDIKPSMVVGSENVGAVEKIPGTFIDKDGKRWDITQATTKEIEANTSVRYYKNGLASSVLNFLNLRKAERAHDFLEAYKNSPDFRYVAVPTGKGSVPAGWRPTELPQLHGYAFEPHTAEVLDWYAKRLRSEGPSLYRQIGDFMRTAIFFNPLIHTPNIGVHWAVEKGLTGAGPQNWGRILRTGSRAIDAVIHQNKDFLDALDAGAPLQSARLDAGTTTGLLLQRMGIELESNPSAGKRIADALGYANPVKLVKAIYGFSSKATWVTNDVAMLQAAYEHVDRTGSSFKDAIDDVSKHIPDYRLPTRIFNSTALAKLMSNPDLTMFGAYHYGALRSYGEMAKGLLSEDMPQAERMKSLDRLAMLGLVTFVAYPALDQFARLTTGDKTAQMRRAGASTFIYNLAQLAKGDKEPTDVLQSVVTPAVLTKAAAQLAVNHDLFTGKKIVDWSADGKTIAKQLGRYAGQNIAPVNAGMQVTDKRKTLGQQAAGLVGIKTNVATPAEALARKFVAQRAGTDAPDTDTVERSYLRRRYEDDLRNKKITTADLAGDRAAGKLTNQDQKIILQRAARTPLQNLFRSLSAEEAVKVWVKASPEEQGQVKQMLAGKLNSIGKLPPEERADVRARILDALHPGSNNAGAKFGGIPTTPPGME